jgi:hypothetical protein
MESIIIKTNEDIIVGQFYVAKESNGYYYVGIQYGDTKRLVCINVTQGEVDDLRGSFEESCLFPNEVDAYEDWQMTPCDQSEVFIKAK